MGKGEKFYTLNESFKTIRQISISLEKFISYSGFRQFSSTRTSC